MTEAQLISACIACDRKAQKMLFEKYNNQMYFVALRYARNRTQAQDIAQESWIKIFKNIDKYENRGKFASWCTTIVIHTAIRKMSNKYEKNTSLVESFFDSPSTYHGPLDSLQYDDLIKIINQLPGIGKDVFKMSVIDGLKHKEIAKLLNIQESTSRAHLARARAKLQVLVSFFDKEILKNYG